MASPLSLSIHANTSSKETPTFAYKPIIMLVPKQLAHHQWVLHDAGQPEKKIEIAEK